MKKIKNGILNGILDDIRKNNYITEKELSNKYEVSERTIRRYIKILKNENKLKSKSKGLKHKWIINWIFNQEKVIIYLSLNK